MRYGNGISFSKSCRSCYLSELFTLASRSREVDDVVWWRLHLQICTIYTRIRFHKYSTMSIRFHKY